MTRALTLICLLIFTTACSKTILAPRFSDLALRDCDTAQIKGKKWKDSAILARERKAIIKLCNERLAGLRAINKGME